MITLNIKCETIAFLEDNIRKSLDSLGFDDSSLDTTPKTLSTKNFQNLSHE